MVNNSAALFTGESHHRTDADGMELEVCCPPE
jgi:hypothetical protein